MGFKRVLGIIPNEVFCLTCRTKSILAQIRKFLIATILLAISLEQKLKIYIRIIHLSNLD